MVAESGCWNGGVCFVWQDQMLSQLYYSRAVEAEQIGRTDKDVPNDSGPDAAAR